MNLYDQLLQLQIIENAYTMWEHYRKQLTDYLIQHTLPGSSLAILGAGRCNDLDLKKLATHFRTITLMDKDERALKEALILYELEHSPSVCIKEVDFVGITPKDYRDYADTLVNHVRENGINTNIKDLATHIQSYLEVLFNNTLRFPLDLGKGIYDYTVAFGVHSQLISMLEWIWRILLETVNQNEKSVYDTLMYMNEATVQKLNEAVLNATKDTVFMAFEKERIGRVGTIQGAIQGIEDIERRIKRSKIKCIETLPIQWPFNEAEGVSFHMEIYQLKKNR